MIPTQKPLNINPLSSKLHPEKNFLSGYIHMIHTMKEEVCYNPAANYKVFGQRDLVNRQAKQVVDPFIIHQEHKLLTPPPYQELHQHFQKYYLCYKNDIYVTAAT